MTSKRALTVLFGFLLAGWLVFTQVDHNSVANATVNPADEGLVVNDANQELRVKLLLLGVEFVIERTTSGD